MAIQAPNIFGALQRGLQHEQAIRQAPILEAIQQNKLAQQQFNLEQAPILAQQQQQVFEQQQAGVERGLQSSQAKVGVALAKQARGLSPELRQDFIASLTPEVLSRAGLDQSQVSQLPLDDQSLDNLIAQGEAITQVSPQAAALDLRERELLERQNRNATEAERAGAIVAARLNAEKTLKAEVAGEVVSAEEAAKAGSVIGKQKLAKEKVNLDETKIKNLEKRQQAIDTKNTRRSEADNAVQIIKNLLDGDLFSSAFGRFNNAPKEGLRTQANLDARAQVDQVLGLIALESRQKLKGQGTITDSETKTLERSASLLSNPLISDDLARKELRRIERLFQDASDRNILKRQTIEEQTTQQAGQQTQFTSASGITFTVE